MEKIKLIPERAKSLINPCTFVMHPDLSMWDNAKPASFTEEQKSEVLKHFELTEEEQEQIYPTMLEWLRDLAKMSLNDIDKIK